MKNRVKKAVCLLVLAIGTPVALSAQDYNWGVGVRGGIVDSGITFKTSLGGANMLEAILGFGQGTNVYALYERIMPLDARGLHLYYGVGGNVGEWKKEDHGRFTLGVDGVIGVEYKIDQTPVILGIDYKPGLNLIGHDGFQASDFGFNVRVVF
jgi:hypothetical protein